jgi:hypothetical protein
MITTIHEGEHTENKHNDSMTDVLEMGQEVASTKKKKRVRRSQSCKTIIFTICFLVVCSCYNFRFYFYTIVSRFLCANAILC